MARITRSGDGFQPDCRSAWQRDRASAPFEQERRHDILLPLLIGCALFWAAVLWVVA